MRHGLDIGTLCLTSPFLQPAHHILQDEIRLVHDGAVARQPVVREEHVAVLRRLRLRIRVPLRAYQKQELPSTHCVVVQMQRRQGLRIRIRAVEVIEQLVCNIARRCRVEAEEEPVKMNFGSTFAWTRALRIQESRTASRRCRNSVVENTAMNMNSGGRLPSATATAVSSNGACDARSHMTT